MPGLRNPKSYKLRKKLQRIGVDARNLKTWCIILGKTPSEVLCLSDAELVNRLETLIKYIQKHLAINRQTSTTARNSGWTNSDYSYDPIQSCPVRLFAGGPRGLDDTWSDDERQIDFTQGAPHLEYSGSDDSFNERRRPPLANQSSPIRPKSPAPSCSILPKTPNSGSAQRGLDETWGDDAKQLEFSRAAPHLEFSDSDDSFNAKRRPPLPNKSSPIRAKSPASAFSISPKTWNHTLSNTMHGTPASKQATIAAARFHGTPQEPTAPVDKPRWLDYSWSDSKQLDFERNREPPQLEFSDPEDSFNEFRELRLANQSTPIRPKSPRPVKQNLLQTNSMHGLSTPRLQAMTQEPTTPVANPRWLDYSWSNSKQLDFERNREPVRLEFSDPEDSFDEIRELPLGNQSTPIRPLSPGPAKQNLAQTNTMHGLSTPKQATMPTARLLVAPQQATTPVGRGFQRTPHSRSFALPRRIFDDAPDRRNQTMPGMNNDPVLNRSQQIQNFMSTNTMHGTSYPKQAASPAVRSQGEPQQAKTSVDKPRWLDYSWSDSKQREFERNREAAQLEFYDPDDSFDESKQPPLANQSTPIRPESPILKPINTMQRIHTPTQLTSSVARSQGKTPQATTPVSGVAQERPRSQSFAAPRRILDDAPERRNQTMPDMNRDVTLNRNAQQQKLLTMVESFEKAVDDFKKNNPRSPSAPPRPPLPYQYPSPIPPPPRPAGPYQYPVPIPPPLALMPYQYPLSTQARPSIGAYQYPSTPQMGYHPWEFHPYRSLWDEYPSHYQYPQGRPSAASVMSPPGACGANSGIAGCTCPEGGEGKPRNETTGGPGGGVRESPIGPSRNPHQFSESRVQPAEDGGVINISLFGENGENSFTVPLPRGVVLSIQVP